MFPANSSIGSIEYAMIYVNLVIFLGIKQRLLGKIS